MPAFTKKNLYIFLSLFLVGIVIGIILRLKIIILIFTLLLVIAIILVTTLKIREKYLQPELSDLLTKVVQKLNEHNISYWVDYGSLLGLVRDKDVINHDTDTDICIHPSNTDLEKELLKIINELGHPYYLEYRPYDIFMYRIRKELPKPLSLFINPYTDVYGIKLEDNRYTDCSGTIPVDLIGKTQKIEWKGLQVSVPEKIHETLVWRYGENYMTPIVGKQPITNTIQD